MAETTVLLENAAELDKDLRDKESSWSELVPELLTLIGSKMNVVDCFIFRHLVCKAWESSIAGSQVQSKGIICSIRRLPRRNPPHGVPYLMTLIDDVCTFYHPLMHTFCYKMSNPMLSGAQIVFSKYGWLLLSKNDFSLFLFNPLKKVTFSLPDLPLATDAIIFSSRPSSSDFYIVAVDPCGSSFAIIRHGEPWTIHSFKKGFRLSNCATPVLIYGKCYCLGVGGNLGAFDPLCKYSSSVWKVFPHPFENMQGDNIYEKVETKKIYQSFLVERNNVLIRIIVLRDERHVLVSRWNKSSKTWSSEQTLGDQILYVSNAGTLSEKAKLRRTGNSIYFPKMRNNNCIFYSLASKKYLSYFDIFSEKSCFHAQELRNCAWIQPTSTAKVKQKK